MNYEWRFIFISFAGEWRMWNEPKFDFCHVRFSYFSCHISFTHDLSEMYAYPFRPEECSAFDHNRTHSMFAKENWEISRMRDRTREREKERKIKATTKQQTHEENDRTKEWIAHRNGLEFGSCWVRTNQPIDARWLPQWKMSYIFIQRGVCCCCCCCSVRAIRISYGVCISCISQQIKHTIFYNVYRSLHIITCNHVNCSKTESRRDTETKRRGRRMMIVYISVS